VSKPIQIAIVLLCVGASAYLLYGYFTRPSPTANEGIPERLHYKCADPKCGHEYTWERGTETAVDACPKCGSLESNRCAKCQECGLFQPLSGHGSYEKKCPGCGAMLPPLREQQ
jgi:hypothetical protein